MDLVKKKRSVTLEKLTMTVLMLSIFRGFYCNVSHTELVSHKPKHFEGLFPVFCLVIVQPSLKVPYYIYFQIIFFFIQDSNGTASHDYSSKETQ